MGLLRRLWAKDDFVYSLRVFVALSSVMALCWALGHVPLVTPLFLGIIAMALAETDDSWQGRVRAIVVTLGCFALAAFSVQALLAWPPLFVLLDALRLGTHQLLAMRVPKHAALAIVALSSHD